MDSLDSLLPALAEPLGLAGLGALAIWAGASLVRAGIGAWRDAELARIAVQQAMAEALRAHADSQAAQARAVEGIRGELTETAIAVRLIAARVDLLPMRSRTASGATTEDAR